MPSSMTSAQVAAHQAANKCGALFVDTCSLLDLIRLPYRTMKGKGNLRREIDAARAILAATQKLPVAVVLILAPPIPDEFANHVSLESQRLSSELEKHRKMAENIAEAQVAFGSSGQVSSLSSTTLDAICKDLQGLAEALVDQAVHLVKVPEFSDLAMNRVVRRMPPAGRGQEAKDCLIIEHILDCVGLTPGATALFLSSNTKDYCDAGKRQLCPSLEAEFSAAGLAFGRNWAWARAQLGL